MDETRVKSFPILWQETKEGWKKTKKTNVGKRVKALVLIFMAWDLES